MGVGPRINPREKMTIKLSVHFENISLQMGFKSMLAATVWRMICSYEELLKVRICGFMPGKFMGHMSSSVTLRKNRAYQCRHYCRPPNWQQFLAKPSIQTMFPLTIHGPSTL